MNDKLNMLKSLTDAPGVSGDEAGIRKVMREYISPFADEVTTDNLGSLIAMQKGSKADGPKVMVAGHLDEIGFMVTRIDANGYLYFQTLGGWWSQVMLAQRVTVHTRKGELVGIIGSKPPHLLSLEKRKKPASIEEMFIDIGASSKEEAEEFGVRPGDSVVPYFEFTKMKNEKLLLAKAWDNRIGCAVAIDILKNLHDTDKEATVYGVGTVQEEVRRRGATTSANKIGPDIAFAVDTGIAGDTPGISDREATGKLGAGPQIVLYDAAHIAHIGLRDLVIETAEELKIPYQYDTIKGGATDAGSIHLTGNGVPALTIGIPTRYIHTHAAMLHEDDYDNTVKLLTAVIQKLDKETVEKITYS
ncbi:peptidase M28 [Virgibacillus sp. 7505]|uniref:M42 family metallopeptidase n=1 Tax=Bacillaceae TaxID=186817 RepID=UPI000BA7BC6F|nr:M42 family metallopeptidase [Virgibacillus sp. 7505]PAE17397.1 peptidase M28 [Virgibacillus sp. 7505]